MSIWELPDFYHLDNGFFRPQEKKQIQRAYENFILNTKPKSSIIRNIDDDDEEEDEENDPILLQSKLQLFQLFVRTQPVNIRTFSLFHQEQQRVFVERLFYLFLNNVALTHFSSYNVNSIIHISKELEKYQRSTNKTIVNTGKLNTVIQFVLSFSSSTISSFQLNNLFYLLLNDMNDFSGKIIDRIAEVLRFYHGMTYGHAITKQYLLSTIDQSISRLSFVNPKVYSLYENFLNPSFVYKGAFLYSLNKSNRSISSLTLMQNLSLVLLGLNVEDFDDESNYLFLSAEQCYQCRLIIRHLISALKVHHFSIDFPLKHFDKKIVSSLVNLTVEEKRNFDQLKNSIDFFLKTVGKFSESKVKELFCRLCSNWPRETFRIETIGRFLELNRVESKAIFGDNKNLEDDLWLSREQTRLATHRLYSETIYETIFLPMIDGDAIERRTFQDLLNFLDENCELQRETVIDVQQIRDRWTRNSPVF